MSQPPDPYVRQFNFANWNITHPGEPHQGDKIDLELNEVKESLDQTQSRLAEIQADDGKLRASAFPASFVADVAATATAATNAAASASSASTSASQALASKNAAQDSATAAASSASAAAASAVLAQDVIDTNLALLPDKAEARDNLQLTQYFPELNGDNLVILNQSLTQNNPVDNWPSTMAGQIAQGQQFTSWPGIVPTSSYTSRQFRASVLFGTLGDWGTEWVSVGSNTPVADVTARVDNVSMALLYAGTTGEFDGNVRSWAWNAGAGNQIYFQQVYQQLSLMPSAENPLATLRQVRDAIDTHNNLVGHNRIPSATQKAALDAATTASASNRFATLNDLSAGGSLTANQAAAVAGSQNPSASNVVITTTALNSALAGYATSSAVDNKTDIGHLHTTLDITDPLGIFSLDSLLADKANVGDLALKSDLGHTHPISEVDGLQATLDGKAASSHTHSISNVTGLQTALDGKVSSTDDGLAKAWVSFDGSTSPPTIKASKNVSSVTKSSAGVYLVNFVAGTFTDANYCWVASGRNNGSNNGLIAGQDNTRKTQTSTQLHIVTRGDDGSLQEATWCNVVVYR